MQTLIKLCAKCGTGERAAHHHYCKGCKKISDHASYIKHREKRLIECKDYVIANRDIVKARNLAYRQTHKIEAVARAKKWAKANPEKARINKRLWFKRHPKHALALVRKRQNAKLFRTPKFGQDGIIDFYIACPAGMVVDHVIPLQGKLVSGLHVIWNLQYLTPLENSRKGNKYGI